VRSVTGGLDQAEQAQPGRVGERLQYAREPPGVGALDRLAGERRNGRHGGLGSSHAFHTSTNTIDKPAEMGQR
jgi:hypothetical protein